MLKLLLGVVGGVAIGWYIWGRKEDSVMEGLVKQLTEAQYRLAALKQLRTTRLAAGQRLTDEEAKELSTLEMTTIPGLMGQIEQRKQLLSQSA